MKFSLLCISALLLVGATDFIALSEAEQQTAGLQTEELHRDLYQRTLRAYGTVVMPQELIDSRTGYINALTQWQTAEAMRYASEREVQRLRVLHRDGRTVSDKTLEAAESTWLSDQAAVTAAETALENQRRTTQALWGLRIADWIFQAGTDFIAVAEQRSRLIEVQIPLKEELPIPLPTAELQTRSGDWLEAFFVSRAPYTEVLTQGLTLFYLTSEQPEQLPAGSNLLFNLPAELPINGFTIPDSAVVWSGEEAFVYIQTGPTLFARRPIAPRLATPEGWLIVEGVDDGEQLVTAGAQLLLSQERVAELKRAARD